MRNLVTVIMLSVLTLSTAVYAADKAIPREVLDSIEAKAKKDFPNDNSTRKAEIKKQSEAYEEVRNYKNDKVPVKVLEKIKSNTSRHYPHNYSAQIFNIGKQVNSYMRLGLMSSRLFPTGIVECEDLWWKLTVKGTPAVYRGTIKPGSVDVIYVEVRNHRGLIGQNFGFPNPGGAWEVMVWGDYRIKAKHKERFICEKY
jgi:hypothetical protein